MARIGPGGLEIGYWVHRAYTRRGLATAASAALVEQAFGLPGVDRVEIIHDELNVVSGRVPRKLGFTEVGRQPWIVYDVMRVNQAVTGAHVIPVSYGVLCLVYLFLAFAVVWILRRFSRVPLEDHDAA